MYKAVPQIYDVLFEVIRAEFGSDGRGYLSTFEKECLPRRGSDLLPELFPWGYLHISKLGKRLTAGEFYRSGRNGWYQATVSVVLIGMSKDGDIGRLIANPDFSGDASVSAPGLADIAGELMAYMYVNHQVSSVFERGGYQVPRWDSDGISVSGEGIIRKAVPEVGYNNISEYLGAWQVNFNFDIVEWF